MPVPAKPTDTPRWATDGGADVTEPTEGKKDTGWVDGEEPGAETFNWWMNNVYDWQQWAEDGIDALDAEKAALAGATFTGDVLPSVNGTKKLGNTSGPLRWDVAADDLDANNLTLNTLTTFGASHRSVGDLVPNVNITDDLGSSARVYDNVFTRRVMVGDAAGGGGVVDLDKCSVGSDTAAVLNQLSKRNVCKAYGVLTTDGAGNVDIETGTAFNLATPSLTGTASFKRIVCNMAQGMADGNYTVIAMYCGGVALRMCIVKYVGQTAGSFQITLQDVTSGTIGFDDNAASVSVFVMGRQ